MKTILILCAVLLTGCATDSTAPPWARPGWRPDGRLQIAVVSASQRPPADAVKLYQPTDQPPKHTVLSFITAQGDAAEEARIVTMILDYARHLGASGVVLLGPDKPNENLAVARPLWQPTGRRVFRATVIRAD